MAARSRISRRDQLIAYDCASPGYFHSGLAYQESHLSGVASPATRACSAGRERRRPQPTTRRLRGGMAEHFTRSGIRERAHMARCAELQRFARSPAALEHLRRQGLRCATRADVMTAARRWLIAGQPSLWPSLSKVVLRSGGGLRGARALRGANDTGSANRE